MRTRKLKIVSGPDAGGYVTEYLPETAEDKAWIVKEIKAGRMDPGGQGSLSAQRTAKEAQRKRKSEE